MTFLDDLQAAFGRLLEERATAEDLRLLRSALPAAKTTVASGDGAVALGRDARDSVIVTGDGNIIISGADADAVAAALKALHAPRIEAPSFSRLYQLPPPPADFTGREEELAWIKNELSSGGATITGFQGMGGVGKTALVLKVASEVKGNYPDGQIYFNLRGISAEGETPATVTETLSHVLRSFHPDARLPETDEGLQAAYRTVLDGKKVLLVMDNAREASQIEPLIPPAGCVLMVTSRWNFTVPGLRSRDLNVLPREESIALLQGISERIGDSADALSTLCGDLPVALRLAGSALAVRKDLGVSEYLDRLSKSKEKVKLVAASFELSYELLNDEEKEKWRRLAVFPESFERQGAGAVWGLEGDTEEVSEPLGELVLFSLVDWDGERKRYQMHDLAREYAGSLLGAEEGEAAGLRHSKHYMGVLAEAEDLYLRGGAKVAAGLAILDTERVNVEAGQTWSIARSESEETASQLTSGYPNAGPHVLYLRLHPRELLNWLEPAVKAARSLRDRWAEGMHLGRMGIAWAALGEARKAIEYYEASLKIVRELGDREAEGSGLGNLGAAWAALGDARKAIEYYKASLKIARETGDRRAEGHALGNLGVAWVDLGEARKAIKYHEKSLKVKRAIADRRGEGSSLCNLGDAWAGLGDERKAIGYHEESLKIAREIGDRRVEGISLGSLGLEWSALGDSRKAIEYSEAYLDITREIGDRRGEGAALFNLCQEFDKLGKRSEARAHGEEALKILHDIEDPSAERLRRQLQEWRSSGQNGNPTKR